MIDRSLGRSGARLIGVTALVGALALLAACAAGSEENNTTNGEQAPTTTAALAEGEIVGDPGAIRTFTDPATEIEDASDLTDYLLPGMTGPAVDCVTGAIDVDEILDSTFEDGGWAAARVVIDCVNVDRFGRIMAMYATALHSESKESYEDIEACVSREFSESEEANTYKLATVYEARLDLEGPVGSAQIAREEIARMTDCLDDAGGSSGSTTTTTTRSTTTSTATTTSEPDTTTTTRPVGTRQTTWTFVTAGSCVVDLPSTDAAGTTLIPCSAPHGGEVMSAGLGSAPGPDHCQGVADAYLGDARTPWPADVVTITRIEVSGVTRTVCIIGPSDGTKVTGSVKG